MDNSGTAKKHVGRTYAGVDGYCPWVAYPGTRGFCLELTLRPGTQHSACETEHNIKRVLPLAAKVCAAPVLLRADAGFDPAKLMCAIDQHAKGLGRDVAFIIKWNPRPTPDEAARLLDRWTSWVRCCRLPAFKRLGATLRQHRDGIVEHFRNGLSNGFVEAMNAQIQAAKVRAKGYATERNLITSLTCCVPNSSTCRTILGWHRRHHDYGHSTAIATELQKGMRMDFGRPWSASEPRSPDCWVQKNG